MKMNMNMKKFLSSMLVAAMVASMASVVTFAQSEGKVTMPFAGDSTADEDILAKEMFILKSNEDPIETIGENNEFNASTKDGEIVLDGITPGQTFYIWLGEDLGDSDNATLTDNGTTVYPEDLVDKDLFKMTLSKSGDGAKLIESITQVSTKTLTLPGKNEAGQTKTGRGSWLKVTLNDSMTTSELKAGVTLKFKAKKDYINDNNKRLANNLGSDFMTEDTATLRLNMWINNAKRVGTDGEADIGDRIYFDPASRDDNVFIWNNESDEMVALEFKADSDASDFYCRLSTKVDNSIYSKYGDPLNADLYFFNFVSNPIIPTTSRATLTLGYPWGDENKKDKNYLPDPEKCFIYQQDAEGFLTNVTSSFKYSEDDGPIAGWSGPVRQLGMYIISDVALKI